MLTVVEAAKLQSGNELQRAIIEIYAESSAVLGALPVTSIPGNSITYNQEQTLPGIGFRGVNGSYSEATGILNPVTEVLSIAGGDLDVDTYIVETMGPDQRSIQEKMKIKSLAKRFDKTFIKGDVQSTPNEFDGLQVRLTGDQLIAQGSTSGGDVLTLAKLDELIDAVENPTHLIMSKAVRRSLTTAARTYTVGGFITFSVDAFGRTVTLYNDLPILVTDTDETGSAILAFDEANPGGGSSVGTSIYCVSLSDDTLHGIQNDIPSVRDLGELETKPAYRTRVEWFVGMCVKHPKAAARLYGVKAGTVTA